MATEAGGPAPAPQVTTDKKDKKEQPKGQGKDQQPAAAGEKKLTNAELKKKAKEEKAARRAQAKASQAPQGPPQGGHPQAGSSEGKGGGKGKPKQDGHHGGGGGGGGAKLPLRPAATATVVKDPKPTIPDCFSHLSMARRIDMTQADKDVNPAVLVLGEHMSAFAISDSITRLEATLLAFKKVCHPSSLFILLTRF